jgi:hypothetical protein
MGFFDSIFDTGSNIFDSAVSGVENLFGGSSATTSDNSFLGNFDLSSFGGNLSGQGAQTVPAIYQNTMAGMPAIIGGGAMALRGLGAYGIRGLAARFPQLAQRLAASGLTRGAAYSMLKRFGPSALIALGFASLEISQLAVSGSGRRRMNICNGRALRRASRRVSAFHNFYKRTCGLPSTHRRRKCK